MEKYIVMAVIILVVLAPRIAWDLHKRHRFRNAVEEMVSKPFVCPNCGHKFYTDQKTVVILGENKVYLKCPSCGKRAICGRPYDYDPHQD